MKILGIIACTITLGVLLQGCGLFGGPSAARSFHATTSGSVVRQLDGEAVFDSDYQTGVMPHLGLILTADHGSVAFESEGVHTTPKPGQYRLGSFASPRGILAFFTLCSTSDCGNVRSYLSTGGTITFTETSKDRLEGTFDFTATNGADSVHVVGNFDATGGSYDAGLR